MSFASGGGGFLNLDSAIGSMRLLGMNKIQKDMRGMRLARRASWGDRWTHNRSCYRILATKRRKLWSSFLFFFL